MQRQASGKEATTSHSSATGQSSHEPSHGAGKVGVLGLVAIIISAMVGGGIFDLPQNLSQHTSAGGQIIAWFITGIGMWFIATMFRVLANVHPELNDGMYNYAYQGFGRFAGFLVSFGYWICNCCALVAYGILLTSTLNAFIPIFGDGNTVPAIITASAVVWLSFLFGCRGIRSNKVVYIIGTVCKLIPIAIFLVAMIAAFKLSVFLYGFWGFNAQGQPLAFHWDSVFHQVSSSMLVTLWLFIGIEGAVVVSGEAKSQQAVSKATVTGFIGVLTLYTLVSLLPLGSFSAEQIAQIDNPAMAALLAAVVGPWGRTVVTVGIIISVLFAMLVWMVMLSQMPYYGAKDGLYPRMFTYVNKHGAPRNSMLVATIICQVLFILTYFLGNNVWNTITSITATLAMPCYLLCCMYLVKVSRPKQLWPEHCTFSQKYGFVVGILGTLFALFLVSAAGLHYLSMVCVVYVCGIGLFIAGRRQSGAHGSVVQLFTPRERIAAVAIIAVAIYGIVYTARYGL